jgi:hypothetical protein
MPDYEGPDVASPEMELGGLASWAGVEVKHGDFLLTVPVNQPPNDQWHSEAKNIGTREF